MQWHVLAIRRKQDYFVRWMESIITTKSVWPNLLTHVNQSIYLKSFFFIRNCLTRARTRSDSTDLSCTSSRIITLYFNAAMPLSRSCSNTTPAVLKTIFDLLHTLNKFWDQVAQMISRCSAEYGAWNKADSQMYWKLGAEDRRQEVELDSKLPWWQAIKFMIISIQLISKQ
jgi:hypothetical protein